MLEDAAGLLRFRSLSGAAPVAHAFAGAEVAGERFDARDPADLARLAADVAPGRRLVGTRQTHTARVLDAARVHAARGRGEDPAPNGFDGLVSDDPTLVLAAVSADCPLLLFRGTSGSRPVVGVVHAGWRGIGRGVVVAALDLLRARFGVDAGRLEVAMAPAAGGCCYEVGPEVIDALRGAGADERAFVRPGFPGGGGRPRVDLRAAIGSILLDAGVEPGAVEVSPHCTLCGGARFHSYRRRGVGVPHMAALIAAGSPLESPSSDPGVLGVVGPPRAGGVSADAAPRGSRAEP